MSNAAAFQTGQHVGNRRWRGAVLPLAILAIWWLSSTFHIVHTPLLVSPAKVLHTAWHEIVTGHLWVELAASLTRDLSGFIIGTVVGLLLGALLGLSPLAERVINPSFNTFKQVSLFAWIPLISVWFGLGDVAKVVFLSLAALVPVVVNTCDGIRRVPGRYLEVAKVYKFSTLQIVTGVIFPSALPSIFTGIYLALVYSWLATLGGEYLLVSGVGIGNTLIDGSENFEMDLVLFGVFVIGLVGWALNALARVLEHRLLRRYGYR